ncbi:MAG TPA: hypothetical protein VJW73_05470 [Gemmatimonadaceae bacterium]|nr:hypothetical protein [Gemmatimonadaceae bacterium]
MRPRRATWRAGGRGLLVAAALLGSRVAAAQTLGPWPSQRMECDREGPSHDFERITSDSEDVRVLPGTPADLAREIATTRGVRHIPRNRLDYDLVLDIPRLCIEYLELHVDSLRARVSLDARIAGMVHLSAGAGVALDDVNLTLRNVRATALLAVDLSRVVQMVDITMAYLDTHPELLMRALKRSP